MNEMVRTEIEIPSSLLEALRRRSRTRGLTIGQLIAAELSTLPHSIVEGVFQPDDPLLQIELSADEGPCDLAENHDWYLYGEDWERQQAGL